jgi:hypothetical protein
VFHGAFDAGAASEALGRHPALVAYHWKLHPGVTFNHPASAHCKLPTLYLMPPVPRGACPTHGADGADPASGCPTASAVCHCGPGGTPGGAPTTPGSLVFRVGDGTLDWDYPWDLCGSVYRAGDVQAVLSELERVNPGAVRHPNRLEEGGQALHRAGALGPVFRARAGPGRPLQGVVRGICRTWHPCRGPWQRVVPCWPPAPPPQSWPL